MGVRMRLWFVALNVLVAAFCVHGIAQEHHPLGVVSIVMLIEKAPSLMCSPSVLIIGPVHFQAEGAVSSVGQGKREES